MTMTKRVPPLSGWDEVSKVYKNPGPLSGKLRYLRSYRLLFQYEDTNTNE